MKKWIISVIWVWWLGEERLVGDIAAAMDDSVDDGGDDACATYGEDGVVLVSKSEIAW